MSTPDGQIEQTTKRLAEIEALQRTLAAVQQELGEYRDLLSQKLASLQAEVVVPVSDPIADWEPEPPPTLPVPPQRMVTPPAPPKRAPVPSAPAKGIPVPSAPAKGIPVSSAPAKGIPVRPAPEPPKRPAAPAPEPPKRPAAPPPEPVKRAAPEPPKKSSSKDTMHGNSPPAVRPTKPDLEPIEFDEGPPSERRSAPRRAGNPLSVQITNEDAEGESLQGWVVDRSSGGLRLLVDQVVETGTVLSVRPTKAHPSLGWVKITVRSCQPERNSFKLGCQFLNKLSWAELQMFG